MITINESELSCRLAHRAAFREMSDTISNEFEMYNKYDADNEAGTYTDEAQEVFDRYYDDYYTIIMEIAKYQFTEEPWMMDWEKILKEQREVVMAIAGYKPDGTLFSSKSIINEIQTITDDYKANHMINCKKCGELNLNTNRICIVCKTPLL